MWGHIRRRQMNGHRFRRQHPLGRYIVDFVCLERGLIIEVDGGQHSRQTAYDSARSEWLESEGFMVLRFWNNEVLTDTEAVLTVILEALENS